jgi:hypothetical protein
MPFRCAQKFSAHWYPTWSKLESLFSLNNIDSTWTVCAANGQEAQGPILAGNILRYNDAAYKACIVSGELLVLDRI